MEQEKDKIEIPIEKTTGKRKQLAIFWSRMLGWVATGCVAPIGVFAAKFGLFKASHYVEHYDEMGNLVRTSIALNGWGIVSCFLIGWTLIQILNEVLHSFNEGYSFTKQIITGIKNRIIPLAVAFFICIWLNGVIGEIMFCLGTIIVSQIIAIPLNPMPEWRARKKQAEDYSDVYTMVYKIFKDKFKSKNK